MNARARLRRWFGDLPIGFKFTLLLTVAGAGGLLVATAALIWQSASNARRNAAVELVANTRIVANNVSAALVFGDAKASREILSALEEVGDLVISCLYRVDVAGGTQLFAEFPEGFEACPPLPEGIESAEQTGKTLTAVVEVRDGPETLGWVGVIRSLDSLHAQIWRQITITSAILAASFAASLLISRLLQGVLVSRLGNLSAVARRVRETNDYSARLAPSGGDEIGQLIESFNQMLAQISTRDLELQATRAELDHHLKETKQANEELTRTVSQLRQTQAELVRTERLASLGSLVAGVAHEINTPVGVSYTAATTFLHNTSEVSGRFAAGTLTRAELAEYWAEAGESAQIVVRNLDRAADLIHSFKQVAVDQSSDAPRPFDLCQYLDEILLNLAPRLRTRKVAVQVNCPPKLTVDGYPGALAQVITNLVNNSLTHAFAEAESGTLRIDVSAHDGWVTLRYADDGRGIPAEHLGKIFDPFFTTRRGSGGSGLGLHVVHNLVSQRIGGTIDVNSTPGKGAEFLLRFPVTQTERAA